MFADAQFEMKRRNFEKAYSLFGRYIRTNLSKIDPQDVIRTYMNKGEAAEFMHDWKRALQVFLFFFYSPSSFFQFFFVSFFFNFL